MTHLSYTLPKIKTKSSKTQYFEATDKESINHYINNYRKENGVMFSKEQEQEELPIFSCGVATQLHVLTRFAIGKQAYRALKQKQKRKRDQKV